jgi:hypothetical protein
MPRLLDYLSPVYAWLAALDPSLPRALFVALVFGTVLLWRKLWPESWRMWSAVIRISEADANWFKAAILKAWQMLPSALIGGLYGWAGTGGSLEEAMRLALMGLLAPLVHDLAWRYQGKLGDGKPRVPPSLPPEPEGKPVRILFENPRDPDNAAMTALRRPQTWVSSFAFVVAFLVGSAIGLTSCTPSAWQAQRDASDVVATVANDTVKPSLLAAYRSTGLLVIRSQPTQESARLAIQIHQLKWKPVWEAWEAFELAHKAWQDQIAAEGNPLPAAMAARDAYCKLRPLAAEWDVELPNFPLSGCAQ